MSADGASQNNLRVLVVSATLLQASSR
ncbi:hypothetical protein MIC448_2420008 [Microbacterium sp. C448]|nr:hypothetical protein MIC448_2420008 [Microbacterium sp. C448]